MRASGIRAADAYAAISRRAHQLAEELDEVTPLHGIPVTELHDEDSLVTTVAEGISKLSDKPIE